MPSTENNRTCAFWPPFGSHKELERVYFPSVARSDMAMDLGHAVHYMYYQLFTRLLNLVHFVTRDQIMINTSVKC